MAIVSIRNVRPWYRTRNAPDSAASGADRQSQQRIVRQVGGDDACRVGTGAEEGRMAERCQAAEANDQVERHHEDRHRGDARRQRELVREKEVHRDQDGQQHRHRQVGTPVHAVRRLRMPSGRNASNRATAA
jgi:hypothetical protein